MKTLRDQKSVESVTLSRTYCASPQLNNNRMKYKPKIQHSFKTNDYNANLYNSIALKKNVKLESINSRQIQEQKVLIKSIITNPG